MATRFTEFEVTYELVDVDAADDASYTATNIKSFSNLNLIKNANSFSDAITLEHNYSILDGTLAEFPNSPTNIPYFSNTASKIDGTWDNAKVPTLDINFSDVHSSYALTLKLINQEVKTVRVTWYNDEVILVTGEYMLDSEGIIHQDVEDYNRITIEFIQTVPNRYVKLYGVYYGIVLEWNETVIKHATMTKEINIISEKLPADILTFELVDVAFGDLNLGNASGIHRFFQRNQPMYAYEWLNDTRLPIGKFFLKTYEHASNVGTLNCVSYIDIMDSIAFNTGGLYNGTPAGTILKEIFATAGITSYQIDSETYNQKLYGTLKPQSCREALREVLFACQSVIDTSNPVTVYVRKTSTTILDTIGRDIKFSTSVKQKEYVSGVHVEYPIFKKVSEPTPISDEALYEKGYHIILFDGPYENITFSSKAYISVIETGTYFVKFYAGRDVTISLSGNGYIEIANSVERNKELDAGRFLNVKQFTSTLSNYANATALAESLLNYYSLDKEVSIKALANDVDVEHKHIVENTNAAYNNYVGVYSQRNFDLTGGFIDDSTLNMTFLTEANEIYFTREDVEDIFLDEESGVII